MFIPMIVLCILTSRSLSRSEKTQDDRTTYVCWEEKCIAKISLEKFKKETNLTSFESMESCRMLCGKYGNLWPLPTAVPILGKRLIPIDPENMVLTVGGSQDVKTYLEGAFNIFHRNLNDECGEVPTAPADTQVRFQIQVQDPGVYLSTNTSEKYNLDISYQPGAINVAIQSKTVFGARHALETVSQLTSRVLQQTVCKVFMIDSAIIKDSPAFRHRGILIDTSRHYIPLKDLRRTISAMAANKLNVLHWHATDSHSFPLQLSKVPSLARLGAYSEKETYSELDVMNLVEYAKLRGVRILMEIDSPAHAGNGWQFGEEQGLGKLVLCRNYHPWQSGCLQPPCGQLNPANPNVYKVLGDVYKNLQDMLPNDMFHMGGDEVYFPCWAMSDEVTEYMERRGYPTDHQGFKKLWAEFHRRALDSWDRAAGHKKTKMVVWTSDLTDPTSITDFLDKDRYIIEAWTGRNDPRPQELMALGYDLIYASVDAWYLDHGFDGNLPYHSWKEVYDNVIPRDPKVLGGEAALWTELADSSSVDTRLWPRCAALAERLWTSPSTSSEAATYRLLEASERLIRRGLKVEPIMPQWCYLNQGLC